MTISNIIFLLAGCLIVIIKVVNKHNKRVVKLPNEEDVIEPTLSDNESGNTHIPPQDTPPFEASICQHTTTTKSSLPINKKRGHTTNSPKTSKNNPKIEPKPQNESQFDLKQAVIYSEILEPKFKEYEQ